MDRLYYKKKEIKKKCAACQAKYLAFQDIVWWLYAVAAVVVLYVLWAVMGSAVVVEVVVGSGQPLLYPRGVRQRRP